MSKYLRIFVAGCVAVFMMSLFAGSAFANRSLTVNRTAFRATSRAVVFAGSELNTTCEVTLNGATTVTAVQKSAGAALGVITEGKVSFCRGSIPRAVFLFTVANPIRLSYASFTGTLPRITAVGVMASNVALEVQETVFGNCLYRGDAQAWTLRDTGGRQELNQMEFVNAPARLFRGGIFCPATSTITGTLALTPSLRIGLI